VVSQPWPFTQISRANAAVDQHLRKDYFFSAMQPCT
jgi:hypothetical protein